jgi:predicted metalloprotease
MLWKGREQSENVEDQRGISKAGIIAGGGIGAVIIVAVAALFGFDPRPLLNQFQGGAPQQGQRTVSKEEEELREFAGVVLKDTEDVWTKLFEKRGKTYENPKLVLFTGRVESACGSADAAVGPFYCPADHKVYLDLEFFQELKTRFKAGGDFAQAYVIAHEVGHHVQNLLGYSSKVRSRKGRLSDSVRLELQADYLAGVWAYHAQKNKKILEAGDLEKALRAANAIGDDTLQKQAQGTVVPDSFTHGTSAQRVRWFRRGFETGDFSKEQLDYFFESDEL